MSKENDNNNKALSFIEKLKLKSQQQKNYGGETENIGAKLSVQDCPSCGAGRAKVDGLTHCAYCGFEFISTKLTDGIYIKKGDNST